MANTASRAQNAVLYDDDDEPDELRTHEDREPALAPVTYLRVVLPRPRHHRHRGEERAVVRGEQARAGGEAARQAPEHVGGEPAREHAHEHGAPRARLSAQTCPPDGGGAGHDEEGGERERPPGHARARYSGRQRSRRRSTCLMPSAMTMPIIPRVTSATIMSAAFSVPSDWMMR